MRKETYESYVKSLTTASTDGLTAEDVSKCREIIARAFAVESAVIRAIMELKAAKEDCQHNCLHGKGVCVNCTNVEHFCPKRLMESLKAEIQTKEESFAELKRLFNAKWIEMQECIKREKPVEMACGLCIKQEKCQIIAELNEIKGKLEAGK